MELTLAFFAVVMVAVSMFLQGFAVIRLSYRLAEHDALLLDLKIQLDTINHPARRGLGGFGAWEVRND